MKKLTALILIFTMLLTVVGCSDNKKDDKSSSSSQSSSQSDQQSSSSKSKVTDKVQNTKNMFEDNGAVWEATEDGENVETLKFEQETEFNVIRFDEDGTNVNNVMVEAMINGEFKEIYNQDEMGARAGVVDMVKTNEVRITIVSNRADARVNRISFEKVDAFKRDTPFRVASYIVAPFNEGTLKAFDEKLKMTTDAIIIGLYSWDENGNINKKTNDTVDTLEKNTKELEAAIKAQNSTADMWVCVGSFIGNKDKKDMIFSTPEIRANFIKQAVEIVKKHNFKGVSMDYEYPDNKNQWANYDALIIELKAALKAQGKQLSLALAPWGIEFSQKAIDSIDQVQAMLYDRFDFKRRHSAFSTIDKGISYFTKLGFKKSQLNLSLALYGRAMDKTAKEDWPSYAGLVSKNKAEITKDTNFIKGSYFTGVTMNKDKTFAAIEKQCGGIMTWHYACDLPFTDELSIYKNANDIINTFIK